MLLVRLYGDLLAGQKPSGIPDDWPAEVKEVPEGTPDPKDGRLLFKDAAELEAYRTTLKGDYDAWKESVDLPVLKAVKSKAIDARTVELIAEGYAYGGKQLSLSAMAQVTLLGLDQVRDDPSFAFPVVLNTIDDADTYQVKDATDAHALFLAAVAAYRQHKDSGTQLKDQVRAAATVAELDAVKDGR
ncbi:MAG: hypothetical protein ACREMO_00990 [Gemmatimonadales bacterium]